MELDDALTELKRSKDRVSVENLRKYYSTRYKKDQSFEDFFNESLLLNGRSIEPSTLEVYKRLPKKLAEFRMGLSLRDIDRNFIKAWDNGYYMKRSLAKIRQITTCKRLERFC